MMPGTVARLAGARRRWRTWLNQNADWPLLHTEVPLVHAAEYGMSQPVGGCFPPVLHGVSGSATPVSGAGARHNSLPTLDGHIVSRDRRTMGCPPPRRWRCETAA